MNVLRKEDSINWRVVGAVALLCCLSLALFFVQRGSTEDPMSVADTVVADTGTMDNYSDRDYYAEVANDFSSKLPSDKEIVATLIDDSCHYVVYYEKNSAPSCYLYDLETLTTEVLFGGENGFYAATKLLILGEVKCWQRVGNEIFFVAGNRAPESDYPSAILVFSLHLMSHKLTYIDVGANAYFPDPAHLVVIKAQLLHRNFFSNEDTYRQYAKTFELATVE